MHPVAPLKKANGCGPSLRFSDRTSAGVALAALISAQRFTDPFVVTVPNGGVPVALPVAERLAVELRLCLVAKIPLPSNPPVGLGALSWRGGTSLNRDRIAVLDVDDEALSGGMESARRTLRARIDRFADLAVLPDLRRKTCILVDDGLASGFTALAALSVLRQRGARRCVVAAPVGSQWARETLQAQSDAVLTLHTEDSPRFLVDNFYADFADLSADDVRGLLDRRPDCGKNGTP